MADKAAQGPFLKKFQVVLFKRKYSRTCFERPLRLLLKSAVEGRWPLKVNLKTRLVTRCLTLLPLVKIDVPVYYSGNYSNHHIVCLPSLLTVTLPALVCSLSVMSVI